MNEQKKQAENVAVAFRGFQIWYPTGEELEVDRDYNLVKGHGLQIGADEMEGVIHSNARGLIVLNENGYHIVREGNGDWLLCTPTGAYMSSPLKEKNLKIGKHALMFDERGKLRLGQRCSHYAKLTYPH